MSRGRRGGLQAQGAALLAVLALATGCGSTVAHQGTVQAGQGGADGFTTSPDGLTAVPGTTGGALPGGSTGTGGGTSGGTTGPPSGVGTSGGTGAGGGPTGGTTGTVVTPEGTGPVTGRGFTATTIRIGVGTADDANALANSFGIEGVGYTGDPNVWMRAVRDDINSRGGLLGRKVELVKHDYNTAQLLNDPAAAHQEACATWTQDAPVAAVTLAGIGVEDTLLSCTAKAGTPVVYPGASLDYPLHYSGTYARFPLLFNLAQMVGERFDRLSVSRLVARGFFTPWDTANGRPGTAAAHPVKVGLLGFDDRDGEVQEASRKKELAGKGLPVADEASIKCPRALTAKIQCMQSAVLRFASARVTHVVGPDTVFMNNADSQGYRPRYFVTNSTAAFAANASATQLSGAMGQGYVPYYDVAPADYPGDPTPATKRCRDIMRRAGQVATDHSTLALQSAVCDELFFLEAAVKASGRLDAAGVRAGFEALGSSQQSALTWRSLLSPAAHTSASALRDLEYKSDVERFTYTSKVDHSG